MLKKGLLLVALLFSAVSGAFAKDLQNFVVFGDSLSDNGNLYEYFKRQLPPSPPYFKGRFSNGYIWVEQLSQNYYPHNWRQHIQDYAFGGAGVAYSFEGEDNADDDLLFSLGREVDSYLLAHQDKAAPDSLFAVWIGSNNYIASKYSPEKTARGVVGGIKKKLELLAAKGAKHVLVINLPDMGKSPAAKLIYSEKQLSLSSQLHNQALAEAVAQLTASYPDVQWLLFDAAKTFDSAMQNPAKYGFTNVTDTCYQSLADDDQQVQEGSKFILRMSSSIDASAKSKDACDGYFFFDLVHPTALTHKVMSEMMREFLNEHGVVFG